MANASLPPGTGGPDGPSGPESRFGVFAIWLDEQLRGVDVYRFKSGVDNIFTCNLRFTGELDRGVPYLTSLEFTGSQVNAPSYDTGETIEVTATFSEEVTVGAADQPAIALQVGGNSRTAAYHAAGSSGNRVIFRYTVAAGDRDDDGISLEANAISGAIGKAASTTVSARLDHHAFPDDPEHLVNTVPTLLSVDVTSKPSHRWIYNQRDHRIVDPFIRGYYGPGDTLEFTLTFNMPVVVTGDPEFEFSLEHDLNPIRKAIPGQDTWILYVWERPEMTEANFQRRASYDSTLSGGNRVVFTYTVGDVDSNEEDQDGVSFATSTDSVKSIKLRRQRRHQGRHAHQLHHGCRAGP